MLKIKTFSNHSEKSKLIEENLKNKLKENNFTLTDATPDIAVAIGGDGTFIKMVKSCNYNQDIIYVGINSGNLGFLQNINPTEIDEFIVKLKNNDYKVERISLPIATIYTKDNKEYKFLNEIVIRASSLKALRLKVRVDGQFLQNYIGDGILVSSSTGSTAYNLSFGGSMVYNTLHTLQLTPIAPLNNTVYRNIINSLILPHTSIIELIVKNKEKDLFVTIDGENEVIKDVSKIEVRSLDEKIKFLRLKEYHYIKTVNEKFVKTRN